MAKTWKNLLDPVNQVYDNTTSGLTATDVKSAIDEIALGPYYTAGFYPGAPTASAKMMVHVFPAAVDIASAMAGSYGTAETSATAQTDFDVQKNGSSVGTMRFAAAATTATFIMASATSFALGDKLQLIAPATPDSTLADIAWSFKGTKT